MSDDSSLIRRRRRSGASSLAASLLGAELDGISLVFTDQSIVIRDTTTPANAVSSKGIVSNGIPVGPGSKLTYTLPSPKMCRQSDGLYRYNAHNLCLQSEDFTSASWNSNSQITAPAADTLKANAGTAISPFKGQNITAVALRSSYTLSFEAKAGTHSFLQISSSNSWGVTYQNVNLATNSFGTGNISGAVLGTPESVGDGWYRYTVTAPVPTDNTFNVRFSLQGTSTDTRLATWSPTGTETVLVRKVHVRREPVNTDYVKTTTTALYVLPYEWDASGNCLGILPELAATNLHQYSRDLTQSARWPVITCTTAKDATGVDGVANSASSIVLNTLGGYCTQTTTSLAANSTYILSGFVKQRSGSSGIYIMPDFLLGSAALGTETVSATEKATNSDFATDLSNWTTTLGGTSTIVWSAGAASFTRAGGNCRISQNVTGLTRGKAYLVEVNISAIGGGTALGIGRSTTGGCFFNTTGVKKALIYMPDGTSATLVLSLSADGTCTVDYVSVKEVTNASFTETPNSSSWTYFTRTLKTGETIQSSTTAISPVATGETFEFDMLQLELGTISSSPIVTPGSTATRLVDQISIADTLFPTSTTGLLLFGQFIARSLNAARYICYGNAGQTNYFEIVHNASNQVSGASDGTNGIAISNFTAYTSGTVKAAHSVKLNEARMAVNGVDLTPDTVCTVPNPDALYITGRLPTFGAMHSHIQKVMLLPRAAVDQAEVNALTV